MNGNSQEEKEGQLETTVQDRETLPTSTETEESSLSEKQERAAVEERDSHDIYKVSSWVDCPFRLSNTASCRYARGIGNGSEPLVDCTPPDPTKNHMPQFCPLVIGDVTVALIQP